ncbi:MAG: 8-oxo-dGTP diphosphatase [Elusimicrobia bacterium]|nr:8-oxo-dGTP diphosphatase [Elusimicrobiota bacterium]
MSAMNEPDWSAWKPTERAVLCFVIEDGRMLLIRKKLGLGAGKINGPGGRIEPGETPLAAALRETEEEVGLTPTGVSQAGELLFQFKDGYALHCSVFKAAGAMGELRETDEALPFWVALSAIPYQEMWADDERWLPWLLSARPFRGLFCFDGDLMVSGRVEPWDRA